MMEQMKEYSLSDTSIKEEIYLSGTKRVDSIDPGKIFYNIFRIEIDEYPDQIKVYARVMDSLGHFVTNMADPYRLDSTVYFTAIKEQLGKVYDVRHEDIKDFKVREFGAKDSIPYNIVMSVDYSGSMSPVMSAIYDGTDLFVGMKMPYDRIALTSFNNKGLDVKVPLSHNKQSILNLYNVKKEQGMGLFSNVNDAVFNAIDLFENTDEEVPRVLVIFTDGDDNYSRTEIGSLIEKAKENNISIFSVAFGYSKDEHLRYMAKYTGGKFYKAYTREELIAIFRDIYMSLRYYYFITYKPPEFWGYHKINALLNHPEREDTLYAYGEYDTSDLFPWDDISKAFQRPILFAFDSATIRPQSYPIINELVDAMKSRPKLRLEIQGHTDNVGGVEYNMNLSKERAKAVMNAMLERGIDPRRLRARGFGMSEPVASNETEEGRAQNRRTEFVILAK
ncbi:MAG: OmpA family protein [Candidatus Kapaibacterium sp.]